MFRSATLRDVPARSATAPRTADVWLAHPGYIGAFSVDVFLAGGLGLSALTSDPLRFTAPAYAFMRDGPGGIATWGAALTIGAVLLVLGAATTARFYALVLYGGTAIYFLIALWIGASAFLDPRAAWWGTILFAGIGIWHTTQANEHRRSARQLTEQDDVDLGEPQDSDT